MVLSDFFFGMLISLLSFSSAISEQILEKVGIISGCILECDDFLQKLEFRIRVQHVEELKPDEFEIAMDSEAVAKNGLLESLFEVL